MLNPFLFLKNCNLISTFIAIKKALDLIKKFLESKRFFQSLYNIRLKMIKFLAFLLLINFTYAQTNFWWPCNDSSGVAPTQVTSPACSGTQCNGVRGESLTADIVFTPRQNHNDLRVRVVAFILGLAVELPGEYPFDNVRKQITLV